MYGFFCRVSELLYRLLSLLKPYLNHPYQNVRDRLGSVLTNIFLHDVQVPGGTRSYSPRVEPFVRELLPQLACLLGNGVRDSPVTSLVAALSVPFFDLLPPLPLSQTENDAKIEDEEERACALRLLKTVSQWLAGMWSRTYGCGQEQQLLLLPYLCSYESNDKDKELARECALALCFISQTVMHLPAVEVSLNIIHQIAQSGTWKAKISVLEFLQVMPHCSSMGMSS